MHFIESDFQNQRNDKKFKYRKYAPPSDLKLNLLHPKAVPSNFPGLPKHYNKETPKRRSESTAKEARFQKQYEANELAVKEFLAADTFSSIHELQQKLESDLPKGSKIVKCVFFCLVNEDLIEFFQTDFMLKCFCQILLPKCFNELVFDRHFV